VETNFQSICVFCGSQSGTNPAFADVARLVGKTLAKHSIRIVYGGGSVGLMGIVADSCLDAGGEVIGVITHSLMEAEVGHTGVTRLEQVETMLERKARMAELSDGFISLPGGIGTMDELFEMLTWTRLGIHQKPNGLLNVDGFYDELISFVLKTQVEGGFISGDGANNLLVSDKLDDLLEKMSNYVSNIEPRLCKPT